MTTNPTNIKTIITNSDKYKKEFHAQYFKDIGYDYSEKFNPRKTYYREPFYRTFECDERRYIWIDYYVMSTDDFNKIQYPKLDEYDHYIVPEEIVYYDMIQHYKHHCCCHNCSLWCCNIWTKRLHPLAAGCFLSGKPSTETLKKTRDEIRLINERNQVYMNISPHLRYGL